MRRQLSSKDYLITYPQQRKDSAVGSLAQYAEESGLGSEGTAKCNGNYWTSKVQRKVQGSHSAGRYVGNTTCKFKNCKEKGLQSAKESVGTP